MPSNRTTVTELATALGIVGASTPAEALAQRPDSLRGVDDETWCLLTALERRREFTRDFYSGFRNGQAFLRADDALAGRVPRIIEWTGGRRPPGDEVVPADLRVDHVYLVSCKYLSRILYNVSPARLVEQLLARSPVDDKTDWYARVAPDQYQALYRVCADAVGPVGLPDRASALDTAGRRRLAVALRSGWPPGAKAAYADLCGVVSAETARRWAAALSDAKAEEVLWRLLRIGSSPYFVLGSDDRGSMRLRIATPWDWQQRFRLERLSVEAEPGGQPRVGWAASYTDRASAQTRLVRGHVEVRWSHGRFGQRPEAKVYLDTPHADVPGYHPL